MTQHWPWSANYNTVAERAKSQKKLHLTTQPENKDPPETCSVKKVKKALGKRLEQTTFEMLAAEKKESLPQIAPMQVPYVRPNDNEVPKLPGRDRSEYELVRLN